MKNKQTNNNLTKKKAEMEDAEVYPPSPNWYSPQVADWDGETFAYGSQNSVVVMRTDVNAPPHAASDASPPPEKKAKREEARNSTKVIRILYGHEKRVNAVAVWGKFVVSGSDDGTARLWDVERGAAVQMCKENGKPISALCVAAESRVVVYGDDSGGIKFWTVSDTSGTPSTSMPVGEPCFKCRVTCLKANGRVVAAAGKDGVIVLLGVDSKQRLATLGSIGGSVHSLSWCKCDIGTFLSASCESSVTVWRLSDGKDADPQSPGPK